MVPIYFAQTALLPALKTEEEEEEEEEEKEKEEEEEEEEERNNGCNKLRERQSKWIYKTKEEEGRRTTMRKRKSRGRRDR